MSEEYSREVLRRTVAQVCQLIGWHGIASTPLDVLVHCLEKYMLTLATKAHRYAEHYSRTEPNLDDLGLAFKDSDVRLCELREYCECVPPLLHRRAAPPFPLRREPKLHFLRPGAAEVLTRPRHVHDHLPPMRPERSPERSPPVAKTVEISNDDDKTDVFKRPAAPSSPIAKRPKTRLEGEDCHARELSSVMMTVSGFLSPAREGKLPEARTPVVMPDAPPERVRPGEPPPFRPPVVDKERSDKKAKKSKALNGKVEKPKKRERPAKRPDRPAALPPKPKPMPVDLFKNHAIDVHQMKKIPLLSASASVPASSESPVLPIKIKKEIIDDPPEFVVPVTEPPVQLPLPPNREPEFVDRLPIKIKVEKPDPEKLTSQPDRSKLNIFKKISTKAKDDKPHDSAYDRIVNDNGAIKMEKPVEPLRLFDPKPKPSNGSNCAVDLSSKKAVVEEPFDITKTKIKQEPPDDYPKDLSRPRLSVVSEKILTGAVSIEPTPSTAAEEKKERLKKKRKERKLKQDRVMDMLVKKQQDFQKMLHPESREPVNAMPPMFPFFPMGPGLIPGFGGGPGLIPGGNLFSNFVENSSALRGLLPQTADSMLPNPFSMRGGVPNMINPNLLSSAPGLVPPAVVNPRAAVNHGFGQPPRMPQPPNLPQFLRRPSLEVIPIEEDQERTKQKRPTISPALVIKEKEKTKISRLPTNSTFASTVLSQLNPQPKANPVIPMPLIKPDVTIKLNSPVERAKIEPKREPILAEEPPVPFVPKEKVKDKSEKKKDKLHKKEKKDKEQKIKKKKDKKDKSLKSEKKKEKLEKQELKDKLKKEKKEKRKEKEKALASAAEGVVPKLTLKLGSSSPMLPPSPDATKKLNIKPVIKKEEIAPSPVIVAVEPEIKPPLFEEIPSPELARISALVTRPPKSKSSSKHPVIKTEIDPESGLNGSPPGQSSGSSPARAKPLTKFKRIFFKPIPKRNSSDYDDSIIDLGGDEALTKEAPEKVPNVPIGAHFYKDPQGNKVWICPACAMPDNGTPMIGCDGCDGWYHWVCVGINVAPDDSEDWYCTSCIAKRTAMATAMAAGQTGKKRGRKPKAEKLKEIR